MPDAMPTEPKYWVMRSAEESSSTFLLISNTASSSNLCAALVCDGLFAGVARL